MKGIEIKREDGSTYFQRTEPNKFSSKPLSEQEKVIIELYSKLQEKDPMKLGIPNINFSMKIDEEHYGDDRIETFKKQRLERGFDDSELWSLCNTIASFIIPRLEAFVEHYETNTAYSSAFDSMEDQKICYNKILIALELVDRDEGLFIFTSEEQEQLEEGLSLLSDHFLNLWN